MSSLPAFGVIRFEQINKPQHRSESKMASKENSNHVGPLPSGGWSRWKDIEPYFPFSRETYRLNAIAGTVPRPTQFGSRVSMYKNDDVNAWLLNPNGFSTRSTN